MPLTGLAALIYPILRERVPSEDPRLSYEDLVVQLGPLPAPNQNLQAYDKRLFAALGDVGVASHDSGLPALSSIVVQRTPENALGMPGPGYYPATHPNARNEEQRIEAWLREYQRARQTTYPAQI